MYGLKMSPPRNRTEAVTLGLVLALVAPSDEKAAQASEVAKQCAQGLTGAQVEACKTEALRTVAEAEFGGGMELLH